MRFERPEDLLKLYPPRPTHAASPPQISRLRGYVAQYKYNDIRTLIYLFPNGEVELRTRKRVPHQEYRLTSAMKRSLLGLKLDRHKVHVLDGGVLRHFSYHGEQPIILWDVIVHDDNYLLGSTVLKRHLLLSDICRNPCRFETLTGKSLALEVTRLLWFAPVYIDKFDDVFRKSTQTDLLEGIILKSPQGRLEMGFREENNTRWQIKVRKPRADYRF